MSLSGLPRNRIIVGQRIKHKEPHIIKKNKLILDNICTKYGIGDLPSITSSKLSTYNGIVTYLQQEFAKGNMKYGILLLKCGGMDESTESDYDLIQIEIEKKEKERKKQEIDMEAARKEIESVKKMAEKDSQSNDIEMSNAHRDMLTKLLNENPKEQVNNEYDTQSIKQLENEIDIKPKDKIINQSVDKIIEDETEIQLKEVKKKKGPKTAKDIRTKVAKEMRDMSTQKANIKTDMNKNCRNCISDMKSKFGYERLTQYRYLEIRVSTTYMVIDNAKIYKLNIQAEKNKFYLLIIGDIQLKSKLIETIDPNYKPDRIYQEHAEFMKRMEANKETIVTKLDEDIDNDN